MCKNTTYAKCFSSLSLKLKFWYLNFGWGIQNNDAYIFIICDAFRNGIKQRKNSWQDGVLGTNCPIPPNTNFTYKFQAKDQIGTFTYFPSTQFHKAAGGYGAFNIYQRPRIPVPYPYPDGDFSLLIGDWYKSNHKVWSISIV